MNSTEIAKLAGVSRSTVSRVINNYSNVPESTRKKVQEVIDKYGYIPDSAGRSLAGKKNKVIGVVIIDHYLKKDKFIIHDSPYLSEFISYSTDVAEDRDYNILISVVTRREKYKKVKDLLNSKIISGAIFVGGGAKKDELDEIIALGQKNLLIDEDMDKEFPNVIKLFSENYQGGYLAAKELIENGHTKIGHITGEMLKFDAKERLRGFKTCLKEYGIKFNSKYIGYGDFTEDSGLEAIKQIYAEAKDDMPTALFVANDVMAIRAAEFLKEKGINVPEDISIIGFDNDKTSEFMLGGLTTISRPVKDLAENSVNMIIDFIEKEEKNYDNIRIVKVDLLKRNTVKCLKE